MTTANLSLHSQRALTPAVGETNTGIIYVGQIEGSRYDAALRFAPPADIAGATITSVTLTIRATYSEAEGGVLARFGLAANSGNLASQDLDAATASSYDYLHSPTYGSFDSPPASSEEVAGTPTTYTIDITSSATVGNLENDIIVLCQYDDYYDFAGGPAGATISFDGLGDTSPPTLQIVYTPATPPTVIDSDPAIEINNVPASTVAKTVVSGIAAETNTAPASTINRTVHSGLAVETNTAPASTIRRNRNVPSGVAIETNTVPASTVQKNQTIQSGVARESNVVPASVATMPQTIASGLAVETNTVPASTVIAGQVVASGIAREVNTVPASTVQRNKIIVSGIATECNTAPASTVAQAQGGLIRQFFHHLAG